MIAALGVENFSWLELAWTAVAVAGFVFALSNVVEARRDLRAIGHSPRDRRARRLVALAGGIIQTLLAGIQAIFITFGVIALALPPPPPVQLPPLQRLLGFVFQYGLIFSAVALVLVSGINVYVRRKLNEMDGLERHSDRPSE